MNIQISRENLKSFWIKINAQIVLFILLTIFLSYASFLAFNLQLGIVPDEGLHYPMSQSFSKMVVVPYETPASLERGLFIRQNPYLAYWIYGRALNLFSFIKPNATDWCQLVFLRLINIIFSLGTVVFTYLISKELIRNKWWSLFSVFILTNTIMFVFLSSGVSYDNPANFFSVVSLYFMVRILKEKEFISNSLGMILFLCLGALTKFTIIPLAVGMTVVWIIILSVKHPTKEIKLLKQRKNILLLLIIAILLGVNISIYGVNLIKFQSLTPTCLDYYSEEFCNNSPFLQVYQGLQLPDKLTILTAFKQGYPEPIRYIFDTWIRGMMVRIFGIMGGLSYFPVVGAYFQILFYWYILLLVRYFRRFSFNIYSLIGIFLFYTLILFINNYDHELTFGFIQVAFQGRYIFPVISLPYNLLCLGLMKLPNKVIKYATLAVTIALLIYSGPLKFIIYHNSIFSGWFI